MFMCAEMEIYMVQSERKEERGAVSITRAVTAFPNGFSLCPAANNFSPDFSRR